MTVELFGFRITIKHMLNEIDLKILNTEIKKEYYYINSKWKFSKDCMCWTPCTNSPLTSTWFWRELVGYDSTFRSVCSDCLQEIISPFLKNGSIRDRGARPIFVSDRPRIKVRLTRNPSQKCPSWLWFWVSLTQKWVWTHWDPFLWVKSNPWVFRVYIVGKIYVNASKLSENQETDVHVQQLTCGKMYSDCL